MSEQGGSRRIDRIRRPDFVEGLSQLPLDELRRRRDDCFAEREYLSLLRRLVQGRAEILRAEVERRGRGEEGSLVGALSTILAGDTQGPSRGEAVKVGLPEEEMLLARRRVERLVADAGLSDPGALDDARLADAVELLVGEERDVSEARAEVLRAMDTIQDELKRRYRDDPSLVLS
ncbi:MAG TPA: aerial mycelium formation protein [Actinomycetota bacterium]|nr:aerial mycelium formation protein [Actinomycetota bacterium]